MAQLQSDKQPVMSASSLDTLSLLGGNLCLDFANTVDPRLGDHGQDYLGSYTDLVQWSHYAGVFAEEERQNLLQIAMHHPTEANQTFERAIVLRETIYRVFEAVAHEISPQQAYLDALRDVFAEAIFHASFVPTGEGFTYKWPGHEDALDRMLWPIAASAVKLLTSGKVRRVKQCPGAGDCGWLFLDTSKNGSRVWCSMEDCGSRVKMRRQYARKRGSR